jgi:hypothetical protein
MNETAFKSPLDEMLAEAWDELSASEKALCIQYKRLLLRGVKISPNLILTVNEIHEKYPDFQMGCVPGERR